MYSMPRPQIKKVTELRQLNADQTEQIAQMTSDEAEAKKSAAFIAQPNGNFGTRKKPI